MAQFEIRDIAPDFGAEIVGFEPVELDPEDRDLLRRTFDERGLLVFRDLDIDRDYQTYLIDALIDYDRPADAAKQKQRETLVSNKEPEGNAPFGRLLFHSDMMWAAEPFQVLSLYGVEVQPPAVPTAFVNTVAAWETCRRICACGSRTSTWSMSQVNSAAAATRRKRTFSSQSASTSSPSPPRWVMPTCVESHHPLREPDEHPRDRRAPHDESEELLEALFSHLYDPAHIFEHEWREGDLVAWDNLAIQHARSTVTREGPSPDPAQGHQPHSIDGRHRDAQVLQGGLTQKVSGRFTQPFLATFYRI